MGGAGLASFFRDRTRGLALLRVCAGHRTRGNKFGGGKGSSRDSLMCGESRSSHQPITHLQEGRKAAGLAEEVAGNGPDSTLLGVD